MLGILLVFLPILVHELMTFGNAVTNNDWIGFFGSYIGAIIGGIVAYIVSKIQVDGSNKDLEIQLNHEKLLQKQSTRVYIDFSRFIDSLLLKEYENRRDTRILLHHRMDKFIEHNEIEYWAEELAEFIRLEYFGSADCILDIKILLVLGNTKKETSVLNLYVKGINKNQAIYIPLFMTKEKMVLCRIEVEYTTLMHETIRFVSDQLNYMEYYILITENFEQEFYKRKVYGEIYINPGDTLFQNQ